MNSFVTDYNSNTSKNIILPKYSTLVIFWCTHKEEDVTLRGEELQQSDQGFHHLFQSDKNRPE